MKSKRNKKLTLGGLIVAAFQVWGASQGEKMVRWAIKTHRVVIREQADLLISNGKRSHA